ncbi:tautomerase family protein [Dehalococcoidia bacterium]|nr:tautomerase family protein [Dehalococcoidia bacterium]
MPCLDVTMPRMDISTKEELSAKLTEAFTAGTGFHGDIFGIHYIEYDTGNAAIGGKLCDHKSKRPYLHMILYTPRLRRSVKQNVVQALTTAFVDATGKPEWKPVIHVTEHPYDNVGVEGKLLSDAYEECANREFYYDLSDDLRVKGMF